MRSPARTTRTIRVHRSGDDVARARNARHPARRSSALILFALCTFGASLAVRADTVFLKNGNQILDCKVTKETDTIVYLRTPVGDMGVPKSQIHRIQRVKTAYDVYEEKLAATHERDTNGLVKLALWCRQGNAGLREESDELLRKVIEVNENHATARRLLGHLRVGGEWVVPPPLELRLVVAGAYSSDVRTGLELFLKSRKDVRLVSAEDKDTKEADPLAGCTLTATVAISRSAQSRVYGQAVGQTYLGATVILQAQSPWIGRKPVKTQASGQVPAASGNARLAVKNALGSSSASLHKFLDELRDLRAKQLVREIRQGERDADSGGLARESS